MTKREYNQKYYAEHRQEMIEAERQRRISNREVIIQRERDRYPRRRRAMLEQKRKHYAENPEKMRARNKARIAMFPELHREYGRSYRRMHPDKVRERNRKYEAANPQKKKQWTRNWQSNNRWKLRAYDAHRRALEIGATTNPKAVKQFFSWISNQDYVTCTYCGVYITGKAVQIDHIFPLSRGGPHDPDNFAVSCAKCNQSKGNSLLSEWPKCPEKFKGN